MTVTNFPAPLCPKPPDVPEEGIRDFEPKIFPQEIENSCGIEGENIEIKCHSFLSVYLKTITYGRNYTNEKKLCDGEKPDDSKAVDSETDYCLRSRKNWKKWKSLCHEESSCLIPVTADMDSDWQSQFHFDAACNGLKRELRVEHICGKQHPRYISTFEFFIHIVECFPWASYVNSPDCIDTALVLNG